MIRAPGRPSRPYWTERSSFRKKIAAHRPVLPPPTEGFRVGADRPRPGNIAVFQGVASLAPLAVPAGARSRFGRRSGVVLRGKRNFVIEIPIPATPAPDRDSSARCARPEWRAAKGVRRKACRVSFPLRPPRIGLRPSAAARRGTDVSGNVMFRYPPPADGAPCRSNAVCSYYVLYWKSSEFCAIAERSLGSKSARRAVNLCSGHPCRSEFRWPVSSIWNE